MSKRLNVLLVIETSGPGGAETVLFNIAKNLDRERFNPHVVLLRPGWFHGYLLENGIEATIIHSRRSWDISFLKRLASHCRKLDIDIMNSHLPGANLYCSVIGALLKIPVAATFHNELKLPGTSHNYDQLKHAIMKRFVSRSIFVADYMRKEYIEAARYDQARTMTIHNGVEFQPKPLEDELDKLRNELGLSTDDIILGNVANLRQPKGHMYLIEAIAEVCKKAPGVKVLLIGEEGDGKLKNEILHKIDTLDIKANVMFLGFRSDVSKLLYLFDIFVLSSVSEGLPLSAVEAMSAAIPVVATNIGGLPEIIDSGESGYLVEPENPRALSNKILYLLNNKHERQIMGKNGMTMVRREFSLDLMLEQYQELFCDLTRPAKGKLS